MVLGRSIEGEIEEVRSGDPEGPDYGKRIDEILTAHPVFPSGDKDLEGKLEQYRKDLKDKEVTKEEYANELEAILESAPGSFD